MPAIKTLLVTALSLAILWPAQHSLAEERLPTGYTTHYVMKRNSLPFGNMRRSLHAKGDNLYVYEMEWQTAGILSWLVDHHIFKRSTWTYRDSIIKPLRYRYERDGEKVRFFDMKFDWQNNTVTNEVADNRWQMTVPENTYDKLLYQLAIMLDLKKGQTELVYDVVDEDEKMKKYEFRILGEETIETPLGKFKAVRIRRERNDSTTDIWCAASLDYIPVRITRFDEGDRYDLIIRKIDGLTADTKNMASTTPDRAGPINRQ